METIFNNLEKMKIHFKDSPSRLHAIQVAQFLVKGQEPIPDDQVLWVALKFYGLNKDSYRNKPERFQELFESIHIRVNNEFGRKRLMYPNKGVPPERFDQYGIEQVLKDAFSR